MPTKLLWNEWSSFRAHLTVENSKSTSPFFCEAKNYTMKYILQSQYQQPMYGQQFGAPNQVNLPQPPTTLGAQPNPYYPPQNSSVNPNDLSLI